MPHPRIEPFKKVLQIDPNDETAWFGLGKAYMEDKDYEEATSALESCIRVKPTYSAAYYALAQTLHQNDKIEQCRDICQKGIKVATDNGDLMVIKNLEQLKMTLG